MKPLSVRFQCFGPYLEEQYIDFRQLEENGLFLICGQTGSGKTTILDAICYALYGKSSGGLRGDMAVMRCKHAQSNQETFVEFIFSSGENTYRFYRGIKPRKRRKTAASEAKTVPDMNESYECQILEDGQFVPVADAKDKKTFLNEKAAELIGLSYEQFRQVIILPQGQFEKLLVSDSQDKEKILVTLFHAEKWQKIALRMFEKADRERKELAEESLRMEEKLKLYHCNDIEQLLAASVETGKEADMLKSQLEEQNKKLQDCQKNMESVSAQNQAFEQLDRFRRELDALVRQKGFFDQEEETLRRADAAETITSVYRDYCRAKQDQKQKEKEHSARVRERDQAIRFQKIVHAEKTAHEQQRYEYEQNHARITLLEAAKEVYQSLEKLKQAVQKTEIEKTQAQEEFSAAQRDLKKCECVWQEAMLRQHRTMETHQQIQKCYLQGIGSILAEKLQEGEKCPVCGSLHHPEPAKAIQGHITEEQLDQATKIMEDAIKAETAARKKRTAAEQLLTVKRGQLAQKEQDAALAESACNQALSSRVPGVETEEQRNGEILRLKMATKEFETADEGMQKKITDAAGGLQSAEKTLEQANATLQQSAQHLLAAQKIWNQSLSAAGFQEEQAFLQSSLPAQEHQTRKENLIRYRADVQHGQKVLEEQKAALQGKQRPDLQKAELYLKEAQKVRDEVSRKYVLKEKERKDMFRDAAIVQKRMEKYQKAKCANEEAMVFAKRLRGDYGISLQRYVLGVMLTSVTGAANQLLKTIYAGRYQLYRTNETAGAARKRGLELEVADQDGRRSVTTLSGGEKFLLSLSLAIGLAAVVQAQGRGVRLEAMFIDEGFGSLDRNSIDDALDVLQTVRRSAGIVGIISHVDRLAEVIPARIEIIKSKEGSKCRVKC